MRLNFKQIFKVILFTALLSSCIIDKEDGINRKTKRGFFVYAYTADMVLSQYLFCLDVALKIDDFLLETDEQKKDEMMDVFFPNYKVISKGEAYVLRVIYDDESEYDIQILTEGTSLRDENAHWSVLLAGKDKWIDVYRNAASEYRVEAEEVMLIEDALFSSTELVVSVTKLEGQYVDENSVYNYSISGEGSYLEKLKPNENYLHSSYSVEYLFDDKLAAYLIPGFHYSYAYYENMFRYRDGALSMTVPGEADVNETQNIRAVLGSGNVQAVEITYQGVSEIWELSDYKD